MKIIINENENYEIEIPNEIKGTDFLNIIEKFIKLSKFIQISSYSEGTIPTKNEHPIKRKKYNSRRKFFDTKEKVMDVLQYYYHGNRRDRDRITKICGYVDFDIISKRLSTLRIKFNIQPSEVGFITFPTQENRRGIIIRDWIIKSHTGIFDENGTTDNSN